MNGRVVVKYTEIFFPPKMHMYRLSCQRHMFIQVVATHLHFMRLQEAVACARDIYTSETCLTYPILPVFDPHGQVHPG